MARPALQTLKYTLHWVSRNKTKHKTTSYCLREYKLKNNNKLLFCLSLEGNNEGKTQLNYLNSGESIVLRTMNGTSAAFTLISSSVILKE